MLKIKHYKVQKEKHIKSKFRRRFDNSVKWALAAKYVNFVKSNIRKGGFFIFKGGLTSGLRILFALKGKDTWCTKKEDRLEVFRFLWFFYSVNRKW